MKRIAACLSALLLALLVVAEVAASLAEAQVTITLSTGETIAPVQSSSAETVAPTVALTVAPTAACRFTPMVSSWCAPSRRMSTTAGCSDDRGRPAAASMMRS